MAFEDFDAGGTGGSQGPWINWQARESLDGSVPGRTFTLRDQDGTHVFEAFARGVVCDIDRLKTGWCHSSGAKGVAPEWRWNASLARFEPSPGEEWKRGFHLPVAYSKTESAVWEQAQAGAWSALVNLIGLIRAANPAPGKLPVVKHTGAEKVESKKGITYVPRLEIVKWVDRPSALSGAPAVDVAEEPPPPRKAPPKRAPEPEMAEDDMPAF